MGSVTLIAPRDGVDQGGDAFKWGLRQDAVAEVHDVALGPDSLQQGSRGGSGGCGAAEQYGRIDVALHGPRRIASLNVGDVHPPVHRQHFGRQAGVGVQQVGRVLEEEDPRHAGLAHGLEQHLQVRANEPFPIRQRQEPCPGIEDLYGIGAGARLVDQVGGHGLGELAQQGLQQFGFGGGERSQFREIFPAASLHEVGGQRPGCAAESKQSRFGREGVTGLPECGEHFGAELGGVGRRQRIHAGPVADGVFHHRARIEIELDAQRRQGLMMSAKTMAASNGNRAIGISVTRAASSGDWATALNGYDRRSSRYSGR